MSKPTPARHDTPAPSAANTALLEAFARHLGTRPAHTRNAYLRDVGQLAAAARDTPLARLARAQLARILAGFHGNGLSGRSLARMLSAWRSFYRFVLEHDRSLADDPCAGLKAPKSPKRLPSALSPDEAVQLVAIDGDDRWAVRDRALLELAYSS
ncbi:MAG: site-specific integrase, partial [Casimicrobiaceae bacterium]